MDAKNLFLSDSTLTEHYSAQQNQYQDYRSALVLLTFNYHVELSLIKRARILAAALMRNDTDLVAFLLNKCNYDLSQVLKACQILDSRRLATQMERKTPRIKNRRKLSMHKSIISNLHALNEGLEVSLTKSKSRVIIKEWINKISPDQLQVLALEYPKGVWRKLLDLLHTRDDDFQLEWFNNYVWDKPVPDSTVVAKFAQVTKDTIVDLVRVYNPSYGYIRTHCYEFINDQVLAAVAEYANMDTIFHHWNIFEKHADLITKRLVTDGTDMPYGPMMRHLQMLDTRLPVAKALTEIAARRLQEYKIDIDKPVVVLGDASSSMDVAIRTSSIIASVLCLVFEAKLHLFSNYDYPVDAPRTVKDVIRMGKELCASGSTAPAASLKPYLDAKEEVHTFIVVTDEIENTSADGKRIGNRDEWFAPLFKRYREEVYPAKLVFVSFLPDRRDGPMVSALKAAIPEIDSDITQFLLDVNSPDLRKLDDLLNKLTLETDTYNTEHQQLSETLGELRGFTPADDEPLAPAPGEASQCTVQ